MPDQRRCLYCGHPIAHYRPATTRYCSGSTCRSDAWTLRCLLDGRPTRHYATVVEFIAARARSAAAKASHNAAERHQRTKQPVGRVGRS